MKCVWKSNCIWIIRNDSKIKNKSEDRVLGFMFGLQVGLGTVARAVSDINNAFLNGALHEDVFMAKLEGFVDSNKPTYVCERH